MGRRWILGLSLTTGPSTLTARPASSSQTSDDDGLLKRFSGIAIAIRTNPELLHRSPPAHNSLFGYAIERAGNAKSCASASTLVMRVGSPLHRVTFLAPRSPTREG